MQDAAMAVAVAAWISQSVAPSVGRRSAAGARFAEALGILVHAWPPDFRAEVVLRFYYALVSFVREL